MNQRCSSSIVARQAAASLMLVHSTFHCFGVAKSPAPMVMDDHDEEEEDDEADYVAECGAMSNDSDDWTEFLFCVSKRTAQQLIQSPNLVMMSISLKASAFREGSRSAEIDFPDKERPCGHGREGNLSM